MKSLVRSPLRYPGGKTMAVERILARLPDGKFDEYREPFLGGGSVFLAIAQRDKASRFWLNDKNADLYYFWMGLQMATYDVVTKIKQLKTSHPDGRELFLKLTQGEQSAHVLDRAARFFVLNRITFSGTTESGGYSERAFTGRFTDSSIARAERLGHWLKERDSAFFSGIDFENLLARRVDSDKVFIFLDPPYLSAEKSRLYGVKGGLHKGFDHQRLATALKECSYPWLLTYDNCPEIRDLYSFANIAEWEMTYGSRNDHSQPGKELFIQNY